jgi:hypothetical protein
MRLQKILFLADESMMPFLYCLKQASGSRADCRLPQKATQF